MRCVYFVYPVYTVYFYCLLYYFSSTFENISLFYGGIFFMGKNRRFKKNAKNSQLKM